MWLSHLLFVAILSTTTSHADANVTTPKPQILPAAKKKYVSQVYSFQNPVNDHAHHLSNWIVGGLSSIGAKGVTLQNENAGHIGSLWHQQPITASSFELFVDLEITGPNQVKNGEGLALWIINETDYTGFLNQPPPDLWTLYGYKPNFKGLGVFLATSDRTNAPAASVSAAVNDGSKNWDVVTDVPSGDGVYYNFRNVGVVNLWVFVGPDSIKGAVKAATEKDWKPAFTVNLPANSKAFSGYIGFTSSNRRIPKAETLPNSKSMTGDKITITRVNLITDDGDWMRQTSLPGQDGLRRALIGEDFNAQIRALSNAVVESVLPKQELLLKQIGSLQHANRMLAERLDIIQAHIQANSPDKQLEGIEQILSQSHKDSVEKLEEIHGKLNDGEMKQRSKELEETVKTASTIVTYGTIGLGSAILAGGIYLFKRMRDMEKKHLL